jgi:hypothetical protein
MELTALPSFDDYVVFVEQALTSGTTLYLRWSLGPGDDATRGYVSGNLQAGTSEGGLCAVEVTASATLLEALARQLYGTKQRYGVVYNHETMPWLLTGERIGTCGDGEAVIASATVLPMATLTAQAADVGVSLGFNLRWGFPGAHA